MGGPRLPPGEVAGSGTLNLQVWNWTATRRLTGEEAQELGQLPLQAVCRWCGTIDAEDGAPVFHTRGGRLLGGPRCEEWPVIRIQPGCAHFLDQAPAQIAAAVMTGWRLSQVEGVAMAGVQIDWDVPSRLLPAYADLLLRVRALLPRGVGLSCTGLVTWLDAPGIARVAAAVDWWVAQCYSTDVPADPGHATALVSRAPVATVTERCEGLGRPFRIGLPTYEQASLWDATGELLAAALPLSLEQALAAGFAGVALAPERAQGERLAAFRIQETTTCAGLRLPAGALLVVGEPTVASLHAQIEAVRSHARRWCAGISLFRMPRPGDLPCLTARQLRAAWWPPAPAPAAGSGLSWSWERQGGIWTLTIANDGLSDAVHIEHGLRLAIEGVGAAAEVPEGLRLVPARDGIPVGPSHATGVILLVPFMRAQARITVTFAAAGERKPTCQEHAVEVDP
jgi:hypothetical protein